jgi:hypothetical protein
MPHGAARSFAALSLFVDSKERAGIPAVVAMPIPERFFKMQKDTPQRDDSPKGPEATPLHGKGQLGRLKDQKGPGKQNPNPGDQGPHGGGEGITGMQPGAGHPRGR